MCLFVSTECKQCIKETMDWPQAVTSCPTDQLGGVKSRHQIKQTVSECCPCFLKKQIVYPCTHVSVHGARITFLFFSHPFSLPPVRSKVCREQNGVWHAPWPALHRLENRVTHDLCEQHDRRTPCQTAVG